MKGDSASPPAGAITLRNRLSAFTAGFTLSTARTVADSVAGPERADLLVRDLFASGWAVDGPGGRFRLAADARAAAAAARRDRACDADARDAHLAWAADLCRQASQGLEGPEQAEWLDCLAAELGNLEAALEWAARLGGSESALRMAADLARYWEIRGPVAAGRRWLEVIRAANPDASPAARAAAANSAGLLALRAGDVEAAREAYGESLALHWELGDRLGTAGVLHSMGNLAFGEGDLAEARRLFEEVLAIGREASDRRIVAASLTNLGAVAQLERDYRGARSLYAMALDEWRTQGDSYNLAAVLANLADTALALDDEATARHWAREAVATRRRLGDTVGAAEALERLAAVARRGGERRGARRFETEARAMRSQRWSPWAALADRVAGRRTRWPHRPQWDG